MENRKKWIVTLKRKDEARSEAIQHELKMIGFEVERAFGPFILGNSEADLRPTLQRVKGVEAIEESGQATIAEDEC